MYTRGRSMDSFLEKHAEDTEYEAIERSENSWNGKNSSNTTGGYVWLLVKFA